MSDERTIQQPYRIVMTGASSEVGQALLRALDQDPEYAGAMVYGQYHSNAAPLESLGAVLTNLTIVPYACDLSDEGQVDAWMASVLAEGTPTHLVHLAADKLVYHKIKDTDTQAFRHAMAVQVFAAARIVSQIGPLMAKAHFGRVVFLLSSVTIGTPPKYTGSYTTVKYALEGYMRAVAAEYAGKGVTCNGISPGMMDTQFLSEIDPRMIQMAAQASPPGRLLRPEECTDALRHCMSAEASDVSGINLDLSGGDGTWTA